MADSNISEEKLKEEIENILKNASLENTSTKKVIQKLEKTLKTDLSAQKKLIDELVMNYVNSLESSDEEDPESEEEPVAKKTKAKPSKATKEDEDDADDDEEKISVKEETDEDFEAGKRKTRKVAEKKKKGKKGGVTKRGKKGNGYTKAYKLSPALSELVGATELPRHEVVKRVWAFIKERQLLDPKNRQFAICDKPLYNVIGTHRFYTFGMMKYLKNHFIDE